MDKKVFRQELRETVIETLREPISTHELIFVDVEIAGAVATPIVRVFIDVEGGGITLDQVAEATQWISETLDAADPVESSYTLEVSSPGIDRDPDNCIEKVGTTK